MKVMVILTLMVQCSALSAVVLGPVHCNALLYCAVHRSLLQRSAVQRIAVSADLFGISAAICKRPPFFFKNFYSDISTLV